MRRRFVQFPHPGAEGGPERSEWPQGDVPHARKFVAAPGRYRTSVGGADKSGEVTFWAEWEAASACEVLDYFGLRPEGAPSYLHRPLPPAREQRPRGVPQNTDPFVFGDRFLYTFCAQLRVQAKKIHELAPGSVIVFGSVVQGRFVCDTVLVVKDVIRHTVADWQNVLDGRVPDAFRLTTLEPMYAWRPPEDCLFSLYVGATVNDPVEDMYSFVPCLPVGAAAAGFPRPRVDHVRGISPNNSRAVAFNRDIAPDEVASLWRAVAEGVLDAGLALGTGAEIGSTGRD